MKIFVCHATSDKQTVLNIVNELPAHIGRWIDEDNIVAGESISETIRCGIDDSNLVVLFVSPRCINAKWVKKEIQLALEKESHAGHGLPVLIPVRMSDITDDSYNFLFTSAADRKYVRLHGYETHDVKACAEQLYEHLTRWAIQLAEWYSKDHQRILDTTAGQAPDPRELWVRISENPTKDLWSLLEDISVQSATSGGITAMGFYKEARQSITPLQRKANPSYSADLRATISLIRTLDSHLSRYVREIGCKLYYLGEETVFTSEILHDLGNSLHGEILAADDFFGERKNSIRVIIDAIDGTENFVRGIPIFCSSVAIFVEEQLRASAIYDPLHHQVYSALLSGPDSDPGRDARAHCWSIASGTTEDLRETVSKHLTPPRTRALATHVPRNDDNARDAFIAAGREADSALHELAKLADTVYMLNSGLFALAQIAACTLDGFVNIKTNPWDVAAGEVILRACGGAVTDFRGTPLPYDNGNPVSVVAASSTEFHGDMVKITQRCEPSGRT